MDSAVVARTDRGLGYVAGRTANRLRKAWECRNCDGTLFGCSVRELFLFLCSLLHSRLIIPPFLLLLFYFYPCFLPLLIPSFRPPSLPLSRIYTYIYSFLSSLPPSFICLYCTFLPSLIDTCIVSFHPPSLPIFIDTYYLFLSCVHYFLAYFIFSSAHPFFFLPFFFSLHLFIPSLIYIQCYFSAGTEIRWCLYHQFNTDPIDNHWHRRQETNNIKNNIKTNKIKKIIKIIKIPKIVAYPLGTRQQVPI